ncbi:hypothetical protein ACVDG5_024805 [Mesorhizobium sp. ORM6]
MVGITLSREQIRSAPPEVRQWLDQEIAATLGVGPISEAFARPQHLAACSVQEAVAVYASIRSMLPVVNVFFELGREGASIGKDGVEAFRLDDIMRRTRLVDIQQVGTCLELIDGSFRQVRNDDDAVLLVLDPSGYCLVATETQHSILAVWTQAIDRHEAAAGNGSGMQPDRPVPFKTFGTVPASSIHLDGAFPAPDGSKGAAFDDGKGQI